MGKVRRFVSVYKLQIIAFLIPVISAFLYYLRYSEGTGNIFIPASPWNDELLYYKQVKDIICGGPKGFYGYNESNAAIGGLGAWSPVVFLPFVIMGKIFGWSFNSSIAYNMLFWLIGFEYYVCVLKPPTKNVLWFGALWCSVGQTHRFIFSVMPESFIAVFVMVYAISLIKYTRDGGNKYIAVSDICMVVLTLMRGYYALFGVVIAIIIFIKKKKIIIPILQVLLAVISAGAFLFLLNRFTAPYFDSLLDLNWLIELFINPFDGLINIKDMLYERAVDMSQYVWLGIAGKNMVGALYCTFYIIIVCFFARCTIGNDKSTIIPFVVTIIILLALWLLYAPYQAGRHLLALLPTGMLILSQFERSRAIKIIVILMAYIMMWNSSDEYNSLIPEAGEEIIYTIEDAENKLPEVLLLSENNPWDNTIIWTGEHKFLYALPTGFGINCCRLSYIQENVDLLKSKYLATDKDSEVDMFAQDRAWYLLAEYGDKRIYQIR